VDEPTPRSRARQRPRLLALVALAAVLLAGGAKASGALDGLELDTVDTRFAVRGEEKPPDDIVLVLLDPGSLAKLDVRPPIPRSVHARLIDRLGSYQPRLIAYDFQFVGRTDPREDRALIGAVGRAPSILLATHAATPPLRVPAGVEDPDEIGAVLGSVVLLNDPDGKIRRIPYRSGGIRSFSVLAAETVTGRRADPNRFPAWIDYRGGARTFPSYAFAAVLDGRVPAGAFRDKLVIVGSGDPIEKDFFPTPVDDLPVSGAEIHANSVATIADGLPLDEASTAVDWLLIVLLALAVPLASLRLSPLRALGVALAALGLFLVAAQALFGAGTIVEVVPPVLALGLATTGALATGFLTETRERLLMRRVFSRFVPESVIDDVMQRADADLRLGGTTLDATVLFCDLRGFTTFAESHSGPEVIDTLNQYLGEMSDAVLAHGGTVVSYMGDGLMAVFGAPIEQPDHAERAVAAAREMLERRLPAFNDWFRERGFGDPFAMGIGVASGSVQSGNVGSQRRIEYAAVGDTTNVAARLEAKTKDVGWQLLVADETRARLGEAADGLVHAGEFVLKGRTTPTAVWSVPNAKREA
jgi:adenylate cyclase